MTTISEISKDAFGSALVDAIDKAVKETCKDERTSISIDRVTFQPAKSQHDEATLNFGLTVQRYPPQSGDVPSAMAPIVWSIEPGQTWNHVEGQTEIFQKSVLASQRQFSTEGAIEDIYRTLGEAIDHCDRCVWKDNWKAYEPSLGEEDNANVSIESYPKAMDGTESGYLVKFDLALGGVQV